MNDAEKQTLRTRIDEILFYMWDPIGVNDEPAARKEYEFYVERVWQMVLENKSKEETSSYFYEIVTTRIEIESNKEHNDEITDYILLSKEYIENF